MMTRPPVIITRPAHQSAPILHQLNTLGWRSIERPLMAIAPVADDEQAGALRQTIQNLDHYQAVVVVSMNAAEIGLQWMDNYWPQAPVGIDWIAVGPSTSDILSHAGLTVHCPTSGFDSEAMLTLPCLHPDTLANKKVLLWRGIGGREFLATTLRQYGATVEYAELYERQEILYTETEWQQALQQKPILMLSSTQALDIVCAQVPNLPEHLSGLIVPSHRSSDDAQRRGFQRVVTAASARDDDMLTCLQEFC